MDSFLNTDKRLIIIGGDYLKCSIRVRIPKCFGYTWHFVRIKLEFVRLHNPVFNFYEVYFCLCLRTPEIDFRITLAISVVFHTLTEHHIFLQCTCIGTEIDRRKIADNGIADAIVVEIYLAIMPQFRPQVAAIGR